jgi:hypothetical protein
MGGTLNIQLEQGSVLFKDDIGTLTMDETVLDDVIAVHFNVVGRMSHNRYLEWYDRWHCILEDLHGSGINAVIATAHSDEEKILKFFKMFDFVLFDELEDQFGIIMGIIELE